MTAVTVGSTTDYTRDDPTNYAGLNNQEPSSPTLSSSDLWLVDPTQLGGETSDTFFPEVSVTNLSETVDQNLIVPFENINSDEPEITLALAAASEEEELQLDDPVNDAIDAAVRTGNVDLASSTSSDTVGSTESQVTTSGQVASFSEASSDSSGGTEGSTGSRLSDLTSGETGGSGSDGAAENTGTTNTASVDATTGETSSDGANNLGTADFSDAPAAGETATDGATTIGTASNEFENGGTFQTSTGEGVVNGAPTDPADVPFSLTESLGLGLLIGIVGLHKTLKKRNKALKTA